MRQLNRSWIESYIKYISPTSEAPDCYHFWVAAGIVAASLKRHVWYSHGTTRIYPNMYTVLVGRPGVGKGQSLRSGFSILREANSANVLSDRLTIEYVLEKLAKGFAATSLTPTGGLQIGTDASALIYAPELSVFATASQYTLPVLADLWDNTDEFVYGTRHKGEFKIKFPCVNILGGSTQEWLIHSIPSNAVGGGFTRRVNFVYAKDRTQDIPWPAQNSSNIKAQLVNDLRHIGSSIQGAFSFEPKARALFEACYKTSKSDEFDDEATASYKTSKWVHTIKLAIALSASESDGKTISATTFEFASRYVDSVITTIASVFRGVGDSDLATSADKVLTFIETKGFASRQDILHSLWRHIVAGELDVILNTLLQAGMLRESSIGGKILYEAIPIKGAKKP